MYGTFESQIKLSTNIQTGLPRSIYDHLCIEHSMHDHVWHYRVGQQPFKKGGTTMATANQIAYWNLQETRRANMARETETHRSNTVNEAETHRHNVAGEIELNRHNIAGEAETKRHNVAGEQAVIIQLNEAKRHNLAQESLTLVDLNEKARHNVATEGLSLKDIQEKTRHNLATESHNRVLAQQELLKLQEQTRHNLVTESETRATRQVQTHLGEEELKVKQGELEVRQAAQDEQVRHNKTSEGIAIANAITGGVRDLTSAWKAKADAFRSNIDSATKIFELIPFIMG